MKRIAILFLSLSFLGFLDSTYLTVEHYLGVVPPCSIVAGCATVTTSSYSLILGIPVALLGGLYYLTILLLSIWYIDSRRKEAIHLAASLTVLGLIGSIWLVYVQLAILHAICIYCMASATTSTILFIAALFVLKNKNKPTL